MTRASIACFPMPKYLWHLLRPVSADDIARATSLRLIQKIGVGVNTIDLEAAKARDIRVCNMPGTNSRAVAEMTLLLMLALSPAAAFPRSRHPRRPRLEARFRACRILTASWQGRPWAWWDSVRSRGCSLPFSKSMDARVIYTDLKPDPELPHAFRELPQLLGEAAYRFSARAVNLSYRQSHRSATPGDDAAGGDSDQHRARRPGGTGCAFGSAKEWSSRARPGWTCLQPNPSPPGEALLQLDNVVVAPHLSWLTTGTLDRSLKVAVENCRRLQAGEPLLHRVV